jgi:alanine racemase
LKINITLRKLAQVIQGDISGPIKEVIIHSVAYDSRLVQSGENKVFFALNGKFRNGSDFISDAYSKGIRVFVVEQIPNEQKNDAAYIKVKNPLASLLTLAKWHRNQFDIPIITIAGTHGKTSVKEWLCILLNEKYNIVKSPKSYNSKLGLALSMLELHDDAELGLFEVSVSEPGEGKQFNELLNPSYGVLTFVGEKFDENFDSSQKKDEYIHLFQGAECVFSDRTSAELINKQELNIHVIDPNEFHDEVENLRFNEEAKKNNAVLCLGISKFLDGRSTVHKDELPEVAMRLETYEGVQNSFIVNDTYSLDKESLEASLQYQLSISSGKKKIVLLPKDDSLNTPEIVALLEHYKTDEFYFIDCLEDVTCDLSNSIVLVKGSKGSNMNQIANQLKLKRHKTEIEVNLSAVRKNLHLIKDRLSENVKCLVMVKANAYGTGLIKMAKHVEQLGVDYLGVAYTDEGVTLRQNGIQCPVLVMNAGTNDFQECIDYNLEPAIYSMSILDELIKDLIAQNKRGFPIHLKLDTGMKRLGIDVSEINDFIDVLKSQPEIALKGVFSHFSESYNLKDRTYTLSQIEIFKNACLILAERVSEPFIRHIANSEGVLNYPDAQFDMVRLGILVYGVSSNSKVEKQLLPVIAWNSRVSQLKKVQKGESIGYGRSYIAEKEMKIAIIPVGYADGYRRSLGNGKGSVYINGHKFYTIGNVCMDMIMIDISNEEVHSGDLVEIIGENQSLVQFSELLDTIPYEVLTSLSNRVHRNYIIS